MIQFSIENDRLIFGKDKTYLGWSMEHFESGNIETLPKDYDSWFPFVNTSFSLGDLVITSGIYEALKKKYPKIKIAIPTIEWYEKIFGDYLNSWNYNDSMTWKDNIQTILGNNPNIDYKFKPGEFDLIYTDHERIYTNLVETKNGIVSCDEPLAEQILRRFGLTESDLKRIDSKPKIYFTEDEIEKCENIIKDKIGNREYGCLLFSARIANMRGRWEKDYLLFKHAKKYKNLPIFYYSQFDIGNTEWSEYFPENNNFSEMGLSIREQIYIKRNAKFNIGYCGGITEAATGYGSDMISLCAYDSVKQNAIRGSKYIFFNGEEKCI